MKEIVIGIAAAAMSVAAYGQAKGADIWPAGSIASQFAGMQAGAKASGSGGATLGDYGSHAIKLSLRSKSGGAEVHAHFDDIFFVESGEATLVTGGTIENAKTKENGETQGTAITGGERRTIAKGDVVNIPAGTPHQLIITEGGEFSTVVVKVKE